MYVLWSDSLFIYLFLRNSSIALFLNYPEFPDSWILTNPLKMYILYIQTASASGRRKASRMMEAVIAAMR